MCTCAICKSLLLPKNETSDRFKGLSWANTIGRFPLPEFTARVHGPSARAVNSGSGNRPLACLKKTEPRRVTATRSPFCTLWPCDLDLWPLTFWADIVWWARYRDGLSQCQVRWLYTFSRFCFYPVDKQTELDTANRFTPEITDGSVLHQLFQLFEWKYKYIV